MPFLSPSCQSCFELHQLRLHGVERGKLYSLQDLMALNSKRQEETRAALERFDGDILLQAQVRERVPSCEASAPLGERIEKPVRQ